MMKKIFLLGICTFGLAFHAQASEMKTGEERQTLEEITRPSWTQNDQKLNEKVRTALKEDVSLRNFLTNIQLKTENNVVYIQGTVASQKEKKAIEDKVRTSPGVTELDSDIKVIEN